jgi:hypothetical protein
MTSPARPPCQGGFHGWAQRQEQLKKQGRYLTGPGDCSRGSFSQTGTSSAQPMAWR